MATIQDMLTATHTSIAQAEKRLSDGRAFLELLESVQSGLPDLPYESVSQHAYKADVLVNLKVENWADVRGVMEKLPPMPAVKQDDGCCSFIPEEACETEVSTHIFPLWVRLHNCTGPEVQAQWYHRLPNGVRLAVHCNVKNTHAMVRWTGERAMSHGSVYMRSPGIHHKFTSRIGVNWWRAPDAHKEITVYWSEGETADVVFATSKHESHV